MTDLENAVFLAIARNSPGKQPAAVLAAIGETHVLIERGRWERVQSTVWQGMRLQAILHQSFDHLDEYGMPLAPGDLDPIADG